MVHDPAVVIRPLPVDRLMFTVYASALRDIAKPIQNRSSRVARPFRERFGETYTEFGLLPLQKSTSQFNGLLSYFFKNDTKSSAVFVIILMDPEEEFECWAELLNACIEAGGDYPLLLPGFERLLGDVCDTRGTLPESINHHTDHFVGITIPSVFNAIMVLGRLPEHECEIISGFLDRCVVILARGHVNNRAWCGPLLYMIYNRKNPVYMKNSTWLRSAMRWDDWMYREVVKNFPVEYLCAEIDRDPRIELVVFVTKLTKTFGVVLNSVDLFGILQKMESPLRKILSGCDNNNLRQVDTQAIGEIVRFVSACIGSSRGADSTDWVDFLLTFGDLCLRSGFLDKAILGAKLMSSVGMAFRDSLKRWAEDKNIVDFIIDGKLHESVMAELKGCSGILLESSALSKNALIDLYRKVQRSHSSQRDAMNVLVVQALRNSEKEVVNEFFDEITEGVDITIDMSAFFSVVITETCYAKPSVTRKTILLILNFLDRGQNIDILETFVVKMNRVMLPEKSIDDVTKFIIERIPVIPSMPERFSCFMKLLELVVANRGKSDRSVLITASIVSLLESNEQNETASSCYVRMLSSILVKPPGTIGSRTVGCMLKTETGLDVLSTILSARGLSFIHNDGRQEVISMLNGLDFAKLSLIQLRFLELIMMTNAIEEKKIGALSIHGGMRTTWKIYTPYISGLDWIIRTIVEAECKEVSRKALSYMKMLFVAAKPADVEKLGKIFKGMLLNMDLSNTQVCASTIDMVQTFISTSDRHLEVSVFGLQRHKRFSKRDITINVAFRESQFVIRCKPTITGSELVAMIACKVSRAPAGLYVMCGNRTVDAHDPICSSGVRDGSLVKVHESYMDREPFVPSCCLTKVVSDDPKVTESVYSLILDPNVPHNDRLVAWRFLMLVPTAPSVAALGPEELATSLKEAKTSMEVRYLLQAAKNAKIPEISSTVIEMFVTGRINRFCLGESLDIVKDDVIFKSESQCVDFCSFLLQELVNPDASKEYESIAELLWLVCVKSPESVMGVFMSDRKRFEDVICTIPPRLIDRFVDIVQMFRGNKREMFALLMSFIGRLGNNDKRICGYFNLVSAAFDESCDAQTAISFAVSLFRDPDSPAFGDVCRFLYSILKLRQDQCSENKEIFDSAIAIFFKTDVKVVQEELVNLILIFAAADTDCRARMTAAVAERVNVKIDRWSYDPSHNSRSSTGFIGLRNLGATCYMNAILQQLFHNKAFTRTVLESTPTEEWQIQFRSMFVRLFMTKLPVVDTQYFTKNWRFYDDEAVNPRMQHDAVEFMQLLLDRLDDTHYKGEMMTIMVGAVETDDFRRTRLESFCTLPLVVKGCKTFNDSVKVFLQKETITNYDAESLGRKIDILTYSRVDTAPDYLVIQLKRFEYDVKKWTRCKVDDRFEFQQDFDLAAVMEKEDVRRDYSLTGVVIHTGTAEGGHYISYVKNGENWFLFNDHDVTCVPESRVFTEAFGDKPVSCFYQDECHVPSAYLLFYAKKELIGTEKEMDRSIFGDRDAELMAAIEQENAEYTRNQAIFGGSLVTMVLALEDLDVLLAYLFNVFAHGSSCTKVNVFIQHIIDVIERDNAAGRVLQTFQERITDIEDILVNCTQEYVIESFVRLVRYVVSKGDIRGTETLVDEIFNVLPRVVHNWRVIPSVIDLILAFCERDIDVAKEKMWISRLINFMSTTLSEAKSTVFLQNIDFSNAFDFSRRFVDKLSVDDTAVVSSMVVKGLYSLSHSESYGNLVRALVEMGLVDTTKLLELVLSAIGGASGPYLLAVFFLMSRFDDVVVEFLESPRVSKDVLMTELSSVQDDIIMAQLISNPKILFHLITCNSSIAIAKAEIFYTRLFRKVSGMPTYGKIEDVLTDKSEFMVKDIMSPLEAEGSDRQVMIGMFDILVDGASKIAADPEKYITGKIANRRYTHMLRIIHWIIIRAKPEIDDNFVTLVLNLFDAFKRMDFVDDCNMIELVRIVKLLPESAVEMITPIFGEIVETIFTRKFSIGKCLEAGMFTAFFDGFCKFTTCRDLFQMILDSESFRASFCRSSRCWNGKHLTGFADAVIKLRADVGSLVYENIEPLFEAAPRETLEMLSVNSAVVDDAFFTKLLLLFFQRSSRDTYYASDRDAIYTTAEFLCRMASSHELVDVMSIAAMIPVILDVMEGSVIVEILIHVMNVVVMTANKDNQMKDLLLGAIEESMRTDVVSWATQLLKLRIVISDLSIEDRNRHINDTVAMYGQENISGENVLINWLTSVVTCENIEYQMKWAVGLLRIISKKKLVSQECARFATKVAELMNDDQVCDAITAVSQGGAPGEVTKASLILYNAFVREKPGLRARTLVLAGIVGEKYAELHKHCTFSYPKLFLRSEPTFETDSEL